MIRFLLEYIGSLLKWFFILFLLAIASLSYLQKHPPCDHSWDFPAETELNCWRSKFTYTCYKCNETKTEERNTDNHDYEVTVLQDATCTEFGERYYECRVCGRNKTDAFIKPHTVNYQITKKPGMFTNGEKSGNCTVCGTLVTQSVWAFGTREKEPYVTKASDFWRDATKKGGAEKFDGEWVQLSGTIKSIDPNGEYGFAYYLIDENNRELICYFLSRPSERHFVGDSVKITGLVHTIKNNFIDLWLCSFSNALTVGDSGDDVLQMKKRMQELGYFSLEKLTPNYTTVTAQRVTMFQEANGLHPTGDANEATLNALYADTAVRNPNKL